MFPVPSRKEPEASKRKDQSTVEVSTPKQMKKNTGKRRKAETPTSKAIAEIVADSEASDSEKTETGDS